MLQCRGCDSKLQGLALSRLGEQSVDESAGEGITTAYAVDDRLNVVVTALIEFLTIIDECFPTVVRSGVRLTQCGDDIFKSEGRQSIASSSLPMHTSTYCMSGRMMEIAFSDVQSFLRKLRSTDTVTPWRLAASQAAFTISAALSLIAGVMPDQWNH